MSNLQHFRDEGQDGVAMRDGQRLIYAAGDGEVGMHTPLSKPFDDLLTELAQANRLERQLRVGLKKAGDVANLRRGIRAQDQVRSCQHEEMHRVRLDDLAHVHQFAEQLGRAGGLDADDHIARLCGHQMMAHRADAADAFGNQRHLVEQPSFAEALETAELVDVKPGAFQLPVVVEVKGDFGVALNARHRLDGNFAAHDSVPVQ